MKRTLMLSSLTFVLLAGAVWSLAQRTGETEQVVAALEGQWLTAQKTSNPGLLAPMLADKFVNTSTDGTVSNKAETLAIVKSSKWESADYKDVKVTVFGSTAIATGVFTGKGTDTSGSLPARMSAGPILG